MYVDPNERLNDPGRQRLTDGEACAQRSGRPVWWQVVWRLLGVATAVLAILLAQRVWQVNRHVGRMELARIFAMAMSPPRRPSPPKPVVRRPPVRRPPRPASRSSREVAPLFSMNPMAWLDPDLQLGPKREPEPELLPAPPPPPEPASPPLEATPEAMRETEVSEVTRQTWTLLCLVMLECIVLAGMSAALDMRRARRNLMVAAWLLVLGAGLTVLAAYVITRWGGFPPLMARDYAYVVWRGVGFAAFLLIVLSLPRSRRDARVVRQRVPFGGLLPAVVAPWFCGLLFVLVAIISGVAALRGDELTIPAWHIIQWVLVGWSVPAALLGLAACTGRCRLVSSAYLMAIIGVVVQFGCWGLPYAAIGPPSAIRSLLWLLPVHFIVLGRLRECRRWIPSETSAAGG